MAANGWLEPEYPRERARPCSRTPPTGVEHAYLKDGVFERDRAASEHEAFVEQSLAEGFPAVRIAAEATVAVAVMPDLEALLAYEARLEALARARPVSGLCFYDRRAFGPDLTPFANAHPKAVADGQVRAWAEPGLIRLAGEVDISNVDLVGALVRRATAQGGELLVDLGGLAFIDIAGTAELVALARRLAPDNQVRVLLPPPQFRTVLEAVGWQDELDLVTAQVAS